jgi:hypothetical protein
MNTCELSNYTVRKATAGATRRVSRRLMHLPVDHTRRRGIDEHVGQLRQQR